MTRKTDNTEMGRHAAAPWLFLLLFVLLMSVSLAGSAIPRTWAAQTTIEAYQQVGHKVLGQHTSLDIFEDPKLKSADGKLIAPYSKGAYTFAVYNNTNSAPLPYTIELATENQSSVPIAINLQRNGDYVYGASGVMLPLSSVTLPEYMLGGFETDVYTINWAWLSQSDSNDTYIGDSGTQFFTLVITVWGTIGESDLNAPNTGDGMLPVFWLMMTPVSALLVLLPVWLQRRKTTDEKG